MTIQPIGGASVALFMTPADLSEYGTSPHALTRELALALTREAFREAGIPAEGAMEIEAYPDACGVLLFARLTPPGRAWFVFDKLDDLLDAARGLAGRLPQASLSYYEERYWLSVPAEDLHAVCRLTEFALPVGDRPFLDARVAEYGAVILRGEALEILLRRFPR